jgi:hypothetical protein
METFNLKSSKFDVSEEGKMNVYYRHPEKGSIKVPVKLIMIEICTPNLIGIIKSLGNR